ncbi:DUF362 domain-containing protein [Selenomonas montiformis]|uniref:DUF362 domain-containing protein n=1 Tax=Selenomonas montiformis TaxID=2652285 RepID=UPI0039F45337
MAARPKKWIPYSELQIEMGIDFVTKVGVNINDGLTYCRRPPFFPPEIYPEFQHGEIKLDKDNHVYGAVRKLLYNMGLDKEHFGKKEWNPFAGIIKQGNLVVIKPNFVIHHNGGKENIDAVVTHGSVLRPLIDYALLALNGTGEIIIGDAPQANGNFDQIIQKNGVRELVDYYQQRGENVNVYDFRKNWYPHGFKTGTRVELSGDPHGYRRINLKERSFLQDLPHKERLYGADFDRQFVVDKHTNGHEYLYSGSVLEADVVISVPKLKTHRKAGVTINSKNMVGANGDKNYLAHYRVGTPSHGGDEYPDGLPLLTRMVYRLNRFGFDNMLVKNTMLSRIGYLAMMGPFEVLRRAIKRLFHYDYMMGHGDWHGNDTVWRMCLDLNQILRYADKSGKIRDTQQRHIISIVDGIVAGQEDGPLRPTAYPAGCLAGGVDCLFEVDYTCIYMMGFAPEKLKIISRAMASGALHFKKPEEKDVCCTVNGRLTDYKSVNMHFLPQQYWRGYIER